MRANINLYHGDCMGAMAKMADKQYDLAIVDPPYGIGDALVLGGTWSVKWQKKGTIWDKKPDIKYFQELRRVSKNWIIWGGNYFSDMLPSFRHFISWHKPYMDGMHTMSNVELAITSFDSNARNISINKDNKIERIHVTQKPVALYKWLLQNYAKEGDKILDTHGGSMSLAIACWDLKFDLDLWELDEDYYKAGKARFENHIAQQQFDF